MEYGDHITDLMYGLTVLNFGTTGLLIIILVGIVGIGIVGDGTVGIALGDGMLVLAGVGITGVGMIHSGVHLIITPGVGVGTDIMETLTGIMDIMVEVLPTMPAEEALT